MGDTFRYVALDPFKVDNETFIGTDGEPITTPIGVITVRRSEDYLYLDGLNNFIATPTLLPMERVGDVNSPGDWFFEFPNGLEKDEYKFVVSDSAGKAVNSVQQSKAVVDDELVRLSKIAAAGVVGDVKYDETTSKLTLFSYNDNSVVEQVFDIKDEDGNPAGENSWLAKET